MRNGSFDLKENNEPAYAASLGADDLFRNKSHIPSVNKGFADRIKSSLADGTAGLTKTMTPKNMRA